MGGVEPGQVYEEKDYRMRGRLVRVVAYAQPRNGWECEIVAHPTSSARVGKRTYIRHDNLASRWRLVDDDDPWVNPLGCCADHRPGGPNATQMHGGPNCKWPGV